MGFYSQPWCEAVCVFSETAEVATGGTVSFGTKTDGTIGLYAWNKRLLTHTRGDVYDCGAKLDPARHQGTLQPGLYLVEVVTPGRYANSFSSRVARVDNTNFAHEVLETVAASTAGCSHITDGDSNMFVYVPFTELVVDEVTAIRLEEWNRVANAGGFGVINAMDVDVEYVVGAQLRVEKVG